MLVMDRERRTNIAALQCAVPASIEFGSSRVPKNFPHDAIDAIDAMRRPR
jgi:hypothetical protein